MGVEKRGMGKGCPLPVRYVLWRNVVNSPSGVWAEPYPQTILGVACAILYDFTHLLVRLTAAMGDSYIPSLAIRI